MVWLLFIFSVSVSPTANSGNALMTNIVPANYASEADCNKAAKAIEKVNADKLLVRTACVQVPAPVAESR